MAHGDFGYMEEGHLGKPYNIRLLKRLLPFARPYTRAALSALILTLLMSLLDLAPPYLSKIAIDRYILSPWHRLAGDEPARGEGVLEGTGGRRRLISGGALEDMDPREVHRLRREGALSRERYYPVPPDLIPRLGDAAGAEGVFRLEDGSLAVPISVLNKLDPELLALIRAPDLRGVTLVGSVILALLVLSLGLGYSQHYLLERTGQMIMHDIRLRLFDRIQSQTMGFFDRQPVGRLVTRTTNDIENLNELFKSVLVTVCKDVFMLAGIVGILLYINWRLALVCFAMLPVIFGLTLLFSTMAREAFRELRQKVARMNAFLQERVTGMRIIQLFSREAEQMAAFARVNHENFLAGMKQIRIFAVFMPLMELLASVAVALILWHGGGKVLQEQLSLGGLVAFLSYMQMFFKPIRDISEKYNIMQAAMASTERIFEFMDMEGEPVEARGSRAPADFSGGVEFRGVSFAYRPGEPVLRDVSFRIRPGEMVAVVGPTGSGKTTLVNLAERLYEPGAGAILFEGVDARQWPRRSLRSSIGLVTQDVFLFAGSVLENVGLGREGVGTARVETAIRDANALELIQRLPGGLNHQIGEGGATLSAGERQLLALARALAADPVMLVLDEATSSIDPETERLIQQAVGRAARRRTSLVVAHRLSTIREADRIMVMQGGRIREQGTHDELMAMGGIYEKLNRLLEA